MIKHILKRSSPFKLFLGGGFCIIIAAILLVKTALAGFGVSPVSVVAHELLQGSYFEQTVYLVQGDPQNDLTASIEIVDSPVKDWISIDKGGSFLIPAGIQQFPIKVQINVPSTAPLGDYKGVVRIKTASTKASEGQVSIGLGAQVDLDLKVTDKEVFGFVIKNVNIPNLELSWPVKVIFSIKNTGNKESRPTKSTLEIMDKYQNEVIEKSEFSNFDTVKPFQEKNLEAQFQTKLPLGDYWGKYTIYKDEQVLRSDKIIFSIVPKGTINKSFLYKLKIWLTDVFFPWISWVKGLIIILALALVYGAYWAKRNLKVSKK